MADSDSTQTNVQQHFVAVDLDNGGREPLRNLERSRGGRLGSDRGHPTRGRGQQGQRYQSLDKSMRDHAQRMGRGVSGRHGLAGQMSGICGQIGLPELLGHPVVQINDAVFQADILPSSERDLV